MSEGRELIYRFLGFPFHTQLALLKKFELFTEEERSSMTEMQLFTHCFKKARETEKIKALFEEIKAA